MQRGKRITIISLALLLLVAGNTRAQKKIADAPWFFIQLTDPQFGMFDHNAGFEKETVLYEKAVAKINSLKPDFVVITGDFVNDPNSSAQMNEFKRITALINSKIPVYYTPGNHDLGQTPDETSLKKYKEIFGNDRFSFVHKGCSFIGFNTSLIKARMEKQEQMQYKWLVGQLKKSRSSKHIILFCHFPFFNKSVDEPTAYSNIDRECRAKYLDLFVENKVDALFSGHYHNNSLLSYGAMQLVTTSAVGKPLAAAPSGIRIVKIYRDKIENAYFGLEELPESVGF